MPGLDMNSNHVSGGTHYARLPVASPWVGCLSLAIRGPPTSMQLCLLVLHICAPCAGGPGQHALRVLAHPNRYHGTPTGALRFHVALVAISQAVLRPVVLLAEADHTGKSMCSVAHTQRLIGKKSCEVLRCAGPV